jgi:hypothetical protein
LEDGVKPTSESIDRRYSDEKAEAVPWTGAEARLAAAQIAWVVTVRPGGRPHATPTVPVTPDVQLVVFEVAPAGAYGHAKGDPFSQTTYRF